MDYKETVEYLFNATPQFQRIGAAAYKPGLDTARELDRIFGHPHRLFPSIHVAGTNGKGSTCHTLAAILQSQGYRTGLYTSPHLVDFRERMRINGEMIPEKDVIDFVERYRSMNCDVEPSFFELTTIMAFDWFARQGVDVAVIETGLGGRLDTTNIISPLLTIITNISFDHKAQLGDTLAAIAYEKAGIIKPGVPVIVGNPDGAGVREAFEEAARRNGSPIIYAQSDPQFRSARKDGDRIVYEGTFAGMLSGGLCGSCQPENTATVLNAVLALRRIGWDISDDAVREGLANVVEITGLMGRWMKISDKPLTVCDTGHNEGGWEHLSHTLSEWRGGLNMVIGFVSDKDVDAVMRMMPRRARYYFTQASIPRRMDAAILAEKARTFGLEGDVYDTVTEAYEAAKNNAAPEEMVFIGGSTFVVADLLASIR